MNPDYVKKRLAELGLLLLQDQKLPSVVGLMTGESMSRSWWDHPRGQQIFDCLESLEGEAIRTKLIGGKVTFVHRRLWPALYAVGNAGEPWQTKGLSPAARSLLKKLPIRASGAAVKELEKRLLVRAQEVHTESGRHEIELTKWPKTSVGVDEGKKQLEEAAQRIGASARQLPWVTRKS